MSAGKPRLAVWKFSSCDGCQLSLLDCEDELLSVAGAVDIAYFLEATRKPVAGPYDISLVEGSVTMPGDIDRIKEVRRQSKVLITIGACATAGGFQALRNIGNYDEILRSVYAHPEYIDALETSTPIADHVTVDFQLRGCPVSKHQLLEVVAAALARRRPNVPNYSQCVECKRAGIVCVMVAHGTPCLGPVTQAGCGSLCPRCDRGCYGCFGPKEAPNAASLGGHIAEAALSRRATADLFRTFNAGAPAFREEAARHDDQ